MSLDAFLFEMGYLTKDAQWWSSNSGVIADADSEAYLINMKAFRAWIIMYGTEK